LPKTGTLNSPLEDSQLQNNTIGTEIKKVTFKDSAVGSAEEQSK